MMKKLLLSLTLMLAVTTVFAQGLSKEELKAQKKQKKALMGVIADAEAAIVENPQAALDALAPALTGEHKALVANEPSLWYVVAMSKLGIMNQELLKSQEGQPANEGLIYKYCYEIFQDLSLCDSLDNLPDEKGRVKPVYTTQIKKVLYENRNTLFNGGAYLYNNEDFKAAYDQFDTFITSATAPCLMEFGLADSEYNNIAAYYATLCAMRLEDYNMVLNHINIAVKDSANAESAYQFKAEAQAHLGDSVAWLNTLKECSGKFPGNPYFYQSLISYYDSKNKQDELIAFADEMIASDPKNPLFVYVKGYIAQQAEKTDEAIEWYKKTLEIDPVYQNAMANLGMCYIQKMQAYSNSQSSTKVNDKAKLKKDKEIIQGYLREALPIYEQLREIAPDKQNLWLNGLCQCYYGLNMDDKLSEVEKLLPKDEE